MGSQFPAKAIYATVSCVTRRNSDGTPRQKLIKECHVGEKLCLIRDPDHPTDPHAVRVCRLSGDQIGCLRKETASEVGPRMDAGKRFETEIIRLSRASMLPRRPRGVKVLIRWFPAAGQDGQQSAVVS
jgi:hypothetical protein